MLNSQLLLFQFLILERWYVEEHLNLILWNLCSISYFVLELKHSKFSPENKFNAGSTLPKFLLLWVVSYFIKTFFSRGWCLFLSVASLAAWQSIKLSHTAASKYRQSFFSCIICTASYRAYLSLLTSLGTTLGYIFTFNFLYCSLRLLLLELLALN